MSDRVLPVLGSGEAVVIVPAHRVYAMTQTETGVDVALVVDDALAAAMVTAVAAPEEVPA